MTVSLMSLLGAGTVTLSANGGKEAGSEAPGTVTLLSGGDAAFETVMAASERKDVSMERLRAFFMAHGAKVPAELTGEQGAQPQAVDEVLAKIASVINSKKLPGDMLLALQEMLPQDVLESVGQELAVMQAAEGGEWMADLPARELTPEELSELVQETGFPPIVILAALQDTPAASPNLAYAMGEEMGGVESGGQTQLWRGHAAMQEPAQGRMADAANGNVLADNARAIADMMQKGLSRKDATQLSNQLASVDFEAMNTEKRDVLHRIVSILRGEKTQGEFDWSAKPAPANSNQPAAQTAPQMAATPAQTAAAAMTATKTEAQEPVLSTTMQANAGNAASASSQPSPSAVDAQAPQAPVLTVAQEAAVPVRAANAMPVPEAPLRQPVPQSEPVAEQVEVHLRNAIGNGAKRVEIHLKPAELGRVDVRIDTDANGKSHVTVTADKRDTLDMLQRDARGLERALQDAGLKADSNSLSFNLRGGDSHQQAKNGQPQDGGGQPKFDLNGDYADDLEAKLDTSEMALTYDAGRAYRLNLDWGLDISV